MKLIFYTFFFAFLNIDVTSQIIQEAVYDSASIYGVGGSALSSQLMLINFEVSGQKFVKINRIGKKIQVYNLNHTLEKIILYTNFPQACSQPDILYISENLFDIDNKIEFIYLYGDCPGVVHTSIYNEEGICLFNVDSFAPMVRLNIIQQQLPIYNTSQGTKMILSCQSNIVGTAIVYSLPGNLSLSIDQANHQLMQIQNGAFGNLYPNPGPGAVTIEYELPKGEAEGEIVLYNMAGLEVKRYGVDNTFKDIYLDNSMLPAGTYLWQLQTRKGAVGSKKMVVVK